jgi:hypothetical protein
MAPETADRSTARDRLLAAAGELCCEQGVHRVGIAARMDEDLAAATAARAI